MSRAALLAEAKAWRRIAERLATDMTLGLCSAVAEECCRTEDRPGERFDYAAAKVRLDDHRQAHDPEFGGTFVYPIHVRGPRVLAALWLALECEDEASALRPAKRRLSRSPRDGGAND